MLKLIIEVEEGGSAWVRAQDRVNGPTYQVACCGVSGPDTKGEFRTDGEQTYVPISDEVSALLWPAIAAAYAALYQSLGEEETPT